MNEYKIITIKKSLCLSGAPKKSVAVTDHYHHLSTHFINPDDFHYEKLHRDDENMVYNNE